MSPCSPFLRCRPHPRIPPPWIFLNDNDISTMPIGPSVVVAGTPPGAPQSPVPTPGVHAPTLGASLPLPGAPRPRPVRCLPLAQAVRLHLVHHRPSNQALVQVAPHAPRRPTLLPLWTFRPRLLPVELGAPPLRGLSPSCLWSTITAFGLEASLASFS